MVSVVPEGSGVLAELRAREAFRRREYAQALKIAKEISSKALAARDDSTWWQMTMFQAECQREMGHSRSCIDTAVLLLKHSLTVGSSELQCRVLNLLSDVSQAVGELEHALAYGAKAVETARDGEVAQDLRIGSMLALIAALAESDQLDRAWQESEKLLQLVDSNIDTQTTGKCYWVAGNVAFLRQQPKVGVKYHQLAAERLSPSNDLALWAWFNRASAAMRLTAGIADAETVDCMERAELASTIIGTDDGDSSANVLNRAHWHYLNGDMSGAVNLLTSICAEPVKLAHQSAGEANMLLARALRKQGDCEAALRHLKDSEAYFSQAGAKDRAAQVAAEIAGFPQAS
jgi:tetratricopeptide (TPR) repeat protein